MSRPGTRYHVGLGPLAFRREASVFVNCPFDLGYRPVFDAIVFATLCCGFLPRCAVETGTAAQSRMDRILAAMQGSKYSIHDLSRCRGEGDMNLARFNMPLELGMAMSQRFSGKTKKDGHDWLVLVPRGHSYKRFLSDLAGYDPMEYDGSLDTVVPTVMAWLATRPDAVETPTPKAVLAAVPGFASAREELCSAWCDQVPWPDLLTAGMQIARNYGLVPEGRT
jgi:hypothetical protein